MKGSGTKEERYLTLIHFHGGHFESRRFSVNSSRVEVNSSAATTSPRSAKVHVHLVKDVSTFLLQFFNRIEQPILRTVEIAPEFDVHRLADAKLIRTLSSGQ